LHKNEDNHLEGTLGRYELKGKAKKDEHIISFYAARDNAAEFIAAG
jgi:hypothetical protein